MKKFLTLLALLALTLGCGNKEGTPSGNGNGNGSGSGKRVFPTSLSFKKMDLTKASALAVMPASMKTVAKAGEEPEYRLYILDEDGNTQLASLTITVNGNVSDAAWQEIYKTLAMVPRQIIPLSNRFLLLSDVYPVCDYNWWLDSSLTEEEKESLRELVWQLAGNYLLRISDGALFNCPVHLGGEGMMDYYGDAVKASADGNNLVFIAFQNAVSCEPSVGVVSDNGDQIQLRTPSNQLFNTAVDTDYAGYIITSQNRIIPFLAGNGTWSLSMDLSPLYLDYSDNMKSLMKSPCHNYVWQQGNDVYMLKYSSKSPLYRLFMNGDVIDCEVKGESKVNFPKYLSSEAVIKKVENGLVIFYSGGISRVNAETGVMSSEKIPTDFPQNPLGYDENGIAYTCDATNIYKFDIGTKAKQTIPIKWSETSFGGMVEIKSTYYLAGVFTITGLTRTAQTVTVLVDAETGVVTLTDLVDFEGPVISSYYRLN